MRTCVPTILCTTPEAATDWRVSATKQVPAEEKAHGDETGCEHGQEQLAGTRGEASDKPASPIGEGAGAEADIDEAESRALNPHVAA